MVSWNQVDFANTNISKNLRASTVAPQCHWPLVLLLEKVEKGLSGTSYPEFGWWWHTAFSIATKTRKALLQRVRLNWPFNLKKHRCFARSGRFLCFDQGVHFWQSTSTHLCKRRRTFPIKRLETLSVLRNETLTEASTSATSLTNMMLTQRRLHNIPQFAIGLSRTPWAKLPNVSKWIVLEMNSKTK